MKLTAMFRYCSQFQRQWKADDFEQLGDWEQCLPEADLQISKKESRANKTSHQDLPPAALARSEEQLAGQLGSHKEPASTWTPLLRFRRAQLCSKSNGKPFRCHQICRKVHHHQVIHTVKPTSLVASDSTCSSLVLVYLRNGQTSRV